ncbi:Multiple antibiotic resistance protein MarR [Ascidiaceihabitans donghaensis]|uniref:Multiple antibiotic resistance protein MarR n=1 Tax=Ascidiaceihabitans donghaensis TaxID=1510460 RepID=A0A2R8BDL2_9RHOB|nr:MarR family transcriptional regulator [Ascidiaceihabitans donghaensis]SPH21170.1 Multiple antibiotic resistance protein MarR [Ascidiaceihabitans donghaensis]
MIGSDYPMHDSDPFAPLLNEDAFDKNFNIRVLRLASSLSTILQRSTLRDSNVTTQEYRILISIARHGAGHLRAISRKASMDAAHASRTMKAMQSKGWLDRNPDPTDKRLAVFSMTDQGRTAFMQVYPAAAKLSDDFSKLFTEDEVHHLCDMLDRARAYAATRLDDAGPAET